MTISSATSGATIRYTVDGTAPTFASPIYGGPVSMAASGTLKARAFKNDHSPSGTGSADYTIDGTRAAIPTIGPGSGRFATGLQVTISSVTAGATIRYTTNGLDPTETDTAIASGSTILVSRSLRVKAKAWLSGLDPSAVAVADYDIVGNVAAGEQHTLVLKSDGTVWAFGANTSGQIGDTTSQERRTPVQVTGLTNVVAITAGSLHSLALKADSTVWAWGASDMGQIGDGTNSTRFQPVQVLSGAAPLSGVVAIAAGRYHSLALKADGTVFAWGGWHQNAGGGYLIDYRAVQVPTLTGISAISAGAQHSVALKTDGAATGTGWVWGKNDDGPLGDGTTSIGVVPTKVVEDVTAVAAGALNTFFQKPDGTVVATGRSDRGQLGEGGVTSRTSILAAFVTPGVKQLSPGGHHTLALKSDGTVWGSGYNVAGELGDGTFTQRTTPVQTGLIRDVVAVAAGHRTPASTPPRMVIRWP